MKMTSTKLDHDDPQFLIEINQCGLAYGEKNVLSLIDFTVESGQFVSIIGPSGCGKSSLLNMLAGFIEPTAGAIKVAGEKVFGPGPDRGVVFQDLALFPWLNVLDNVSLGLKIQGVEKTERIERSLEIIRLVGLVGNEMARISDLSGGMKQRVAIARTLITQPRVMLMDEPFSALDAQTRELLQDELLSIQQQTHMTIVLVTHSIDEAVYLSDKVIVLQSGGVVGDVIDIELSRPREAELRVTPLYNEYKKQIMGTLQKGYRTIGELHGSGI